MNSNHFNALTPGEAERLALLIEECAEVQQCATKILRHGFKSTNPYHAGPKLTNREHLEKEIGHLEHAIGLLKSRLDVIPERINLHRSNKATTISQWLHHQDTEE